MKLLLFPEKYFRFRFYNIHNWKYIEVIINLYCISIPKPSVDFKNYFTLYPCFNKLSFALGSVTSSNFILHVGQVPDLSDITFQSIGH